MATQNPKGCLGCAIVGVVAIFVALGWWIGWEPYTRWLGEQKLFSAGLIGFVVGLLILAGGIETDKAEAGGCGVVVGLLGLGTLIVAMILWIWNPPVLSPSPAGSSPPQATTNKAEATPVQDQQGPDKPAKKDIGQDKPADQSATSEPQPSTSSPVTNWTGVVFGILAIIFAVILFIAAGQQTNKKDQENASVWGCLLLIIGIFLILIYKAVDQKPSDQPSPPSPPEVTQPEKPPEKPPEPSWAAVAWDRSGNWMTLAFLLTWLPFGLGAWAGYEKSSRGPLSELTREGEVAACIPLMLLVWLLSWLGSDLSSLVGTVIGWLRQTAPGPLAGSPHLALPLLFLTVRLLILPWQFSHERRSIDGRRVQVWLFPGRFAHRAIAHGVLVYVLDALLLFWTAGALRESTWAEDTSALFQPHANDWARLGWVIAGFVAEWLLLAILFGLVQMIFDPLRRRLSVHATVRRRSWGLSWRYTFAQDLLLYLPTAYLILVCERGNPLLLTIGFWFLAVKLVLTVLAEALSWSLDLFGAR
jgi:hypothetical protein